MALVAPGPLSIAPNAALAAEGAVSDSEQAQRDAVASGEPVEVVSERTERNTVFANPDGETFTLEKSIAPVRVTKDGGGWTEPDATLVKRTDGSIGPKAAAVDLSFSPGGDGSELVTIEHQGRAVSLGWPGTLPAPRLEGQRAVYENVRPDVNLILTATVEGFRQVLEVETPEAASDPALSSLEYSMDVEGLRVREGVAGSMDAVDGNGQVVFRSPSARMWNSAGEAAAGSGAGLSAQSLAKQPIAAPQQDEPLQDLPEVPAGPLEEGDPLAGPGAGDEAVVMDVDVTSDTFTVIPDADLIEQTSSAEYPLYIDPPVELSATERTVLSSDGDTFYQFSGGDNGMSVGRCSSAVIGGYIYYCTNGSAYTNRMYFEFKPDGLKGKQVLDATFKVTETWSFSCDPRWVDLERTNEISKYSDWPGPSGPKADKSWDQMGDRHVSAGRGTACSPSQPRAPIAFNDNPEETDENLTPTVKAFADGKFSKLTLMLKAKDESDPIAWKRFDDDGTLVVKYVSKPAVPTSYGLSTSTGQVCSKSSTSPTYWHDTTPTFAATAQAAAGGEPEAALRVYFDVDVQKSDGTWADSPEPATSSMSPPTGSVADGSRQTKVWDQTLAQDTQFRYRAITRSYYEDGVNYLSSSATPFCYFTVDPSAPKPPKITFNSVYTACLPGACEAAGAPGVVGSVSFGPADGSGDVNVSYTYMLSTDSKWREPLLGSTVTENITPVDSGTITLDVYAKDAAGREGRNSVSFLVGEGPNPIGRWTFNEDSGAGIDVSTTEAAQRDDAALFGASRSVNGRRGVVTENGVTREDKALKLAGQAYAATTGKVLETRASYTVAAWVRLGSTTSDAVALGQDGVSSSPFLLGYCLDAKTWCLRMADTDTTTTSLDNQRVNAKEQALAGVWTHLAAVVDTRNKTLTFYVNGAQQGTDTLTAGGWTSNGPVQIGRGKTKGSYTYFTGDVDEVAIWQEAKLTDAVAREASPIDTSGKAYTELVAQYAPAGADVGSTSLSDLSGYGSILSLSSGASLDGEVLTLDGTSGAGTVSRPLVDGTGSFTVATEVAVDSAALTGKPVGYRAQVLGQRTGTGSSWSMWLEKTGSLDEVVVDDDGNPVFDDDGNLKVRSIPTGRWHFGRLTADGTGPSLVSSEPAILDTEVRLVGVYDARTKKITLYVGSDPQADPLAYTATVGAGEFTVGKAWVNSAWAKEYLPCRITDIRLWAGAVTDVAQVETVVGY